MRIDPHGVMHYRLLVPDSLHVPRPLVLVILDGFGERAQSADNAVRLAATPALDAIHAHYPHGLIGTSGPDVGLPVGQMGNSEVGHLNLGAGRIALMDISRIDNAIADRSFGHTPALVDVVAQAKARKGRLHLMGLVSNGGVHSLIAHLNAILELAAFAHVPTVVHAFLDGRDVQPKTAIGYLEEVERSLIGKGVIGTVSGRYWAMDRDNRWERVERAWQAIARGRGPRFSTALEGVQSSFARGQTDEFVEPFVVGSYSGVDSWADAGFHFNFRPDRARELTRALAVAPFDGFVRDDPSPPFCAFACMTTYDASLSLPVAFPKGSLDDIFPEVIARAKKKQFRCAETEKYAHVTYFFNGGREQPFEGEVRTMIPSPKDVATYDAKPEMSARAVADAVVSAIESQQYDFILVNFANPDMIGHTGVLDAAVHAVQIVDEAVGRIVDAARKSRGAVIVTADHGNCELMRDPASGEPHTSHTTNPVPFLYVNDQDTKRHVRSGGRLCDVAPTLLDIMGLEVPAAMTGRSLCVEP